MLILLSALIVSAAILGAGVLVARAVSASRPDTRATQTPELLAVFAPALAAADRNPREILVWEPLAATARQLFPDEFARLDQAAGGRFPFSKERLQAAHARWTAEWLAWERTHDAEYKMKAASVEHELMASGGAPLYRARLDAVEREKLDLYQRRYEEYIRIAKALQALAQP